MKKAILSVHDEVSQCFANPFFSTNVGTGIRDFMNACRDENTQLGRNPQDFNLYHLGDFDDVEAKWEIFSAPVRVALGISFQQAKE